MNPNDVIHIDSHCLHYENKLPIFGRESHHDNQSNTDTLGSLSLNVFPGQSERTMHE